MARFGTELNWYAYEIYATLNDGEKARFTVLEATSQGCAVSGVYDIIDVGVKAYHKVECVKQVR